MDIEEIRHSSETNCLDFIVSDRSFYLVRPERLFFEHISSSPINSFFLLELGTLAQTDVYDKSDRQREELIELDGEYLDRELWDRGYLGHDESGYEIPLPRHAMLTVRFLSGKILVVSKGSIWNGIPATYDGRHTNMTAKQIRKFIESQF